jgi:ribonucleoside-diphosphate reductase alpha chain
MENLRQDSSAAVALAERATLLASEKSSPRSVKSSKSYDNGHHANGHADALNSSESGGRGEQFARFQIDAPSCDNCGSITVRNGNCYLCHNCGNSMGCS